MLSRFRDDVVSAIRALKATPITVSAAMLTLAMAIGINLAMVNLVDRALLSPPDGVADPAGVFTVGFARTTDPPATASMTTTSYVAFEAIRDHAPAIAGAAAWMHAPAAVVVSGDQISASAMLVSGTYFEVLGARRG